CRTVDASRRKPRRDPAGTARTSPARRRHCGCRTRTRSRMKCNQAYIERHEMVTRAGAAPQRDGGRRRPRDERGARGARRAHRPRAGPCRRALLPLARTRRLAPHWRNLRFHAASTMKLPVMIQIFRDADAGLLRLDDSLTVHTAFPSLVPAEAFIVGKEDDSDSTLYESV